MWYPWLAPSSIDRNDVNFVQVISFQANEHQLNKVFTWWLISTPPSIKFWNSGNCHFVAHSEVLRCTYTFFEADGCRKPRESCFWTTPCSMPWTNLGQIFYAFKPQLRNPSLSIRRNWLDRARCFRQVAVTEHLMPPGSDLHIRITWAPLLRSYQPLPILSIPLKFKLILLD